MTTSGEMILRLTGAWFSEEFYFIFTGKQMQRKHDRIVNGTTTLLSISHLEKFMLSHFYEWIGVTKKDHYISGSNEIEYNEFEEYYMKTFGSQNRNEHADLMEAFKTFDKDGNGFIDIDELKEALLNKGEDHLTDDDFKEMIAAVDIDGDGLVNYEGK